MAELNKKKYLDKDGLQRVFGLLKTKYLSAENITPIDDETIKSIYCEACGCTEPQNYYKVLTVVPDPTHSPKIGSPCDFYGVYNNNNEDVSDCELKIVVEGGISETEKLTLKNGDNFTIKVTPDNNICSVVFAPSIEGIEEISHEFNIDTDNESVDVTYPKLKYYPNIFTDYFNITFELWSLPNSFLPYYTFKVNMTSNDESLLCKKYENGCFMFNVYQDDVSNANYHMSIGGAVGLNDIVITEGVPKVVTMNVSKCTMHEDTKEPIINEIYDIIKVKFNGDRTYEILYENTTEWINEHNEEKPSF